MEKGRLWSGFKEMQEMEGFQKCWRRICFIVLWDFNIQCDHVIHRVEKTGYYRCGEGG